MARRRLPGGTKNVPDRRGLACGELNGKGYRLVRSWNSDILGNLEGVLESIVEDSPAESGSPAWGERYTLTLALSREGRGNGELRHERMAHAVPLLVRRALIYMENELVGPFSSFAGVPRYHENWLVFWCARGRAGTEGRAGLTGAAPRQ